jgi:polyisoprenoid-binding protein YceI
MACRFAVDIVKMARQIARRHFTGRISMRKWTLPLVAAAGLGALSIGTLHAQGGADAGVDRSQIEAGTYAADAAHSMVGWRVDHLGFNDYLGIFGDVSGTLELDPANPSAAKVDVTIPVASVVVASAGLKDHLLRAGQNGGAPDFFGPNPAPARFVSTAVQVTGDDEATITGDLTLNGVTKPVTIEAELSGAGTNGMSQKKTVGFHGEAEIKRSEFNMAWGIPFGIGDEIELDITVAFEKQ